MEEDRALQKKKQKAERYVIEPGRFTFKRLHIEMEDNHHISLQDGILVCTCDVSDCDHVQYIFSLLGHLL